MHWFSPRVLLVAVLLLLGAAWLMLNGAETLAPPVQNPQFPEQTRSTRPQTSPTHGVQMPKGEPEAKVALPADPLSPSSIVPAVEHVVTDPPAAESPLHVPEYGDDLERGGGKAHFVLIDAAGQALEPLEELSWPSYVKPWQKSGTKRQARNIATQLRRRLGPYCKKMWVKYTASDSSLHCSGEKDLGLEPGDYELDVMAGPYGALRHRFYMYRGALIEQQMRLPNWRRIICLRLLDSAGNPIPWLTEIPTYMHEPGMLEEVACKEPSVVLRPPPRDRGGQSFGRAPASSHGEYFGSKKPPKYATDQGCIFIRVFAGAPGKLTVKLDAQLFGRDELVIEDTFAASGWDMHELRLDVVDDLEERLKNHVAHENDPGWRNFPVGTRSEPPSLSEPLTEADPLDSSTLTASERRLVVTARTPVDLSMQIVMQGTDDSGKSERKREHTIKGVRKDAFCVFSLDTAALWTSGGGDLAKLPDLTWWVSDGALVESRRQRIPFNPLGITHQTIDLDARRVTMETMVTPTQAAFGVKNTLRLEQCFRLDTEVLLLRQSLQRSAQRLFAEAWITSDCLPTTGGGSLRLSVAGHEQRFVERERSWEPSGVTVAVVPEKGDLSAMLASPEWRLVASQEPAIIARAVGGGGEGLPWVAATIIEKPQDEIAHRLRSTLIEMAQRGGTMDYDTVRKTVSTPLADPATASDEELREAIGALAWENLGDRASREYFYEQGAWYDTHQVLVSDAYGYLYSDAIRLVAGRRYVMYMWSQSREETMPDRRIEFLAASGVTDLGLLRLPSY